jgi:hypothetical protein
VRKAANTVEGLINSAMKKEFTLTP